MRTHRPIYLALDRPDRQVIITCAYHPIIGELFGHLIIASTHHHIESDRERILLDQLMVEVDGREGGPRIVETRHALPQELLTSQLCGAAELCSDLGWRPLRLYLGEDSADEALRILPQKARSLTTPRPDDSATCWIGCTTVDTCEFERLCIRDRGMPTRMGQVDWVLRRDRAQRMVWRHTIDCIGWDIRPPLLVPAPPGDPLTWLSLPDRVLDHLNDLGPTPYIGQIEDHPRLTKPHEVPMPLDEAWNREAALEVDHLGPTADIGPDLLVRPKCDDPVPYDRDRLGLRLEWIYCHNLPIRQDQGRLIDLRRNITARG